MLDSSQQAAPTNPMIVKHKYHGGYIPAYRTAGSIEMTTIAFHAKERRVTNGALSVIKR
jgi:hypothetical protein